MGENMKNPDGVKASIQVTVTKKQYEIKSVAKLDKKEVAYGTAVSELKASDRDRSNLYRQHNRNSRRYMEYRQLRWKYGR